MQMSPRLLQYLAGTAWGEGRLSPPEPLVGAEHFVGSAPERRVFSFYGETFELPHDIDWEHNPGNPQRRAAAAV